MSDGRVRRRAVMTGRVQGVAFRAHALDEARRLGVAGWVRNRADGSVEALLEGPAQAVEAMVRWCHCGPSWARVDSVALHEEPAGNEEGFEIR